MFIRFFLILQLLFLSLFVFANGPDTTGWTPGPSPEWHLTLESAQKAAKQKGRKICVLITGSDWCGWCIRLKRNVLDKEEFKTFARNNLELVYIDLPRRKPLPAAQKKYNSALRSRLGGGGYPTTFVLDASGKVLGRVGGGGWDVAGYIKKLQDPSPARARRKARPNLRSQGPKMDPAKAAALLIQSKFSLGGWGESAASATNKGLPGPQMAGKTCFFRVNYDLAKGLQGRISLRGENLQAFPSKMVSGKGSVLIKGTFRSEGVSSILQITFQCIGRGRFNSIQRITAETSAR